MTAGRRFAARTFGAGLAAAALGWAAQDPAGFWLSSGLVAGGGALSAGCVWRWLRPAGGSNAVIGRWDRRTRRHAGTASRWDLLRTSSTWAMRRQASVLRPSLKGVSWWERRRIPVISYATPLCKVGWQQVWTSCEQSTLRIGIPGTGKTAELACPVIDAPGGVLVTSTATDLYDLTAPLRAQRGPVYMFNPAGIGGQGLRSNLRWSPLSGCTDPAVATRRAADLVGPPSESAEGARWEEQGRRVLAVLLHAAALGGHRMADVHAWVSDPTSARSVILQALQGSPRSAEMMRAASAAIDMSARTRDGVMLAIAPALAWVTQPAAAACGDPDPGGDQFEVADLTDRYGTLFLLGDDDGTVGPLTGALTAEIVYQARAVAAARPGGRFDLRLTLALDEVALVCPVPLDRWMSELRKRNIVIHAACQGIGQLRERWGNNGASMIINSAAAVMLFGGCKDPDDLALFGTLIGEREVPVKTCDADGKVISTTTRMVPVISPSMLTALPNHRVLLICRGMPPAIAETPVVWRRKDVRRANRKPSKARLRPAFLNPRNAKETTQHA